MRVKRLCLMIFFISMCFSLFSFPFDKLKEAGLTDEQIKKVQEIYFKYDKIKREAKAELGILKAKIQKELLAENVNMVEVEKLLKESLNWKLKIEMSNIQKRIELKKLLGEENLQKLRFLFLKRGNKQIERRAYPFRKK